MFTLEAWFKTTSSSGGKIIGRGNRTTSNSNKMDRHLYLTNSGQVAFGVKPDQTRQALTSPGTYRNGAWHYAAASLSPAGMKLYVDGALVAQRTTVTTAEHLARGYWRVGNDSMSSWPSAPSSVALNGDLDEVAVYKRALSDGEIALHYAAGTGAPTPNLPPTADFDWTADGLTAQFTSTSSDSDGTVVSQSWDFAGQGSATTPNPTFTFSGTGTFPVSLTVTDDDGAPHTTTKQVTVTAPPANVPPVADFSWTANGLTAQLTSTSTDSDGTIASYLWSIDGEAPTTPTVTHTFAAAGTYDVELTVTDDDGAATSKTKQVTVEEPPPGPQPFALDAFARAVTSGWGSADLGGAWSRCGPAANFAVVGGQGRIRMNSPGSGPGMYLGGTNSTDSDVSVRLGSDKDATGGGIYLTVQPRLLGNGDRYFADVRLISGGAVSVAVGRAVGNAETNLAAQLVPGLTASAGQLVRVRVQAVGTSPTLLRAKVWADGDPEPAGWTVSVTDSTAALQSAGQVGLRTYLSGSATNAPVLGLFDDLSASPSP